MKTPRLTFAAILFTALAGSFGITSAAHPDAVPVTIASQARALMSAIDEGNAAAASALFTRDARLSIQGMPEIRGREAIDGFWKSALGGGLGGLVLVTDELLGDGNLRVETGNYTTLGPDHAEVGRGQYLLVWLKEAGEWKIARDFAHAGATPATSASPRDPAGLPLDYAHRLRQLGDTVEDAGNGLSTVYANELAAGAAASEGTSYPNGSVILMEFAEAQRDGEAQLVRDAHGRPVKGAITHVDVMRRGAGFGAAYGDSRAGEWEFASYRRDGSTLIAPEKAGHCAACHLKAGAAKDFVYRLRSWAPAP
jgi:ketosteroid isomerase-like protein